MKGLMFLLLIPCSLLLAKRPYHKTIQEALLLVQQNPTNSKNHTELGTAYLIEARRLENEGQDAEMKKNLILARKSFEQAIKLDDKNAEAHNGLGEVFYEMGEYKRALEEAEIAVLLKPRSHHFLSRVALVYYKLEQYDKAIEKLKQAIAVSAKKGGFYYGLLGLCYEKQKKYIEAAEAYLKEIEGKAWDDTIYVKVAKAYRKAGDIENFNKYKNLAGDKWEEAKEGYSSSKKKDGWYYYKQKDYTNAINEFNKAIRNNPKKIANYRGLGLSLKKIGDYNNAIKAFTQLINIKSNYSKAFSGRADCYMSLGKIDEAILDYKKAIKINPEDSYSLQKLAEIHYDKEQYSLAKEYIDKAIDIEPDNCDSYRISGKIELKLENYEKARKSYEKGILFAESEKDKAYYRKGYLYSTFMLANNLKKKNKLSEAIKLYEEIINLAPEDKYAKYAKEHLNKINKK